MNKQSSGFWLEIAVIIAFTIYSVILFTVKGPLDSEHWLLFGFTFISFLSLFVVIAARRNYEIAFSPLILSVTSIYLAVQLVLCGIIMMAINNLPFAIAAIIEFVLLSIYLISILILAHINADAKHQTQVDKNAVQNVRLLESKLTTLSERTEQATLKQELKVLAEQTHYIDAFNGPEVYELDSKIQQLCDLIEMELQDESESNLRRAKEIANLLSERARIVAIYQK